MKKIIFSILSVVVLFGLMACGNQKEEVSGDVSISAESEKEPSNNTNAKNDVPNKNGLVTIRDVQNGHVAEFDVTPSSYVVFDGHYYRMVDEVEQSKLGSQIGEIKRIGDWEIKKDGDSNTVGQGPIFSVIDKTPKEVIATKLWSNRDVYVLFERKEPVEQPDKSKIY